MPYTILGRLDAWFPCQVREEEGEKGRRRGRSRIEKERPARPAPYLILGCDCVILGYSSHFRTMRGK